MKESSVIGGDTATADIHFSMTDSTRPVAHIVREELSGMSAQDEMDYSIESSMRTVDHMLVGLNDSDREELVKSIGLPSPGKVAGIPTTTPISGKTFPQKIPPTEAETVTPLSKTSGSTAPRAIPAAKSQQSSSFLQHQGSQQQVGSHSSHGSAFLDSVLNPGAPALSHTPPTGLGTSYEAQHFGKRARSGSISNRLRSGSISGRLRSSTLGSASDYLEQKGLLDRQTKGILKDLIIIGDEEMQQALDKYDRGDPSMLEDMIRSGSLQNRLPKDLDILGDLDLDFLAMGDHEGENTMESKNIELNEQQQDFLQDTMPTQPGAIQSESIPIQQQPPTITFQNQDQQQKSSAISMVSPIYGDGIGDLEFSGDLVTDQGDYLAHQPQFYGEATAKQTEVANSPVESNLSEYERRLRSNSMFSALLESTNDTNAPVMGRITSGGWMDNPAGAFGPGINISKNTDSVQNQRVKATSAKGGIGASLEAENKRRAKLEKKALKEKKKKKGNRGRKGKGSEKEKTAEDEQVAVHVPGSGKPRSLSDPNLRSSINELGLVDVERPEGWVGAYSPESRKIRIENFMKKRNHRTWTKTVKYDVRKNFADSRLRVKGRFVKKEDELMMRELMSLS